MPSATSPGPGTTSRVRCVFAGQVQGVGFRYCARNLALNYEVGGFVRNLNDGRVELVVEGRKDEVDSYLQSLRGKLCCFIREAEVRDEPPTGKLQQFQIAF